MAPLVSKLLAVGATLFAAVQTVRPENAHEPLSTGAAQDVQLVAVEGRSTMAKQCEPFPGKRVVLVTVSMDYFEMFTNWLASAKPFLRDTEHLHVIAESEDAVRPTKDFLQGQGLDYSVASPAEAAASALLELRPPYLSNGYGSVVWKRPDHIMRFLEVGCSVLYVDIDTVWMNDPFVDIEAAGGADLYITNDAPGLKPRNLCTCFMYYHPSGSAKSLLQAWGAAVTGTANQPIFNRVLQEAIDAGTAPVVTELPVHKYPPGILVADKMSEGILDSAPRDATVFHANWRVGNEAKVKFFDLLSMWKPPVLKTA